ncbi:MAG: SNF2 helicase associated domain-containing protein, partial [Oscillospiraceae bacterium]|nr:SNF2 helicase associated domain-containing protein [Oscillospiraceae bacterium]
MNIKTFTDEISRELCRKGKAYFDEGRIRKLIYNTKGNVRAIVHGTSNHDVEMHIDNKTGMISDVFCDCNTFSRSLCQHCIAVMFACREKYEQRNAPGISSRSVTDLINRGPVVVPPSAEGTVDIIPHISFRPSPAYELTMGITRMYKIRNIRTTYSDFLHGNHIRYGKDLSIDANMSRLTERGRRLLDITMMNFYNHNTSYFDPPSPKLFPFTGQTAEDILNLFAGDTVLIDEQPNRVIKGDPKIEMEIESSGEDFVITNARSFSLVRGGSCDLIHIPDELTVYIASPGFHATMYPILRAAASEDMIVSRKDMPAFYSAVIRQAHKYADFINEEMIASLIPPEMTPQMYIDADKNGNIVGLPVFVYGDRMINYSPADKPDPFRDLISERHIIDVIKDVMHESSDPAHPFICDNDEMIYLFLTEGSKMLLTEMEVYVSERFRSMTVRPPIKPVVGIRPDGDLLSLDISDSNYSHAELLEVLQAYRKGAKFHRLKDGTFASIGEEIAGFEELANNLNITDRQFLKENNRIPNYRMMYLDNLNNMDSIRLKSSSEFKNMVSDYRKQLDGSDLTEVPAQLRGTMRDYQQYGFHWLKTIASYGFGGILADDMGLGKTIQALALMLDAKKNGKTPFLVV